MPSGPSTCPCFPDRAYDDCCGPLHAGQAQAPTAERLMRSRFSAFALGDSTYLERSWSVTTVPPEIRIDHGQRWTRLEVLGTTGGQLFDGEGTVEFRAHHERDGVAGVLHERSRFIREAGRWVYLGPLQE